MYKALLVGCGNIGALYDFENDHVLTHAKAYALHPDFTLTVFDINKELEARVANRYRAQTIHTPIHEAISQFDCVSICSPTDTHAFFLTEAMKANIPVIICEKPISNKTRELASLEVTYQQQHSKVIVNYIRRFQPVYAELKRSISKILEHERLTNIAIRYQRGFINNASHAFDLIQFLFDQPISLTQVQITHSVNDHFLNDPTLSLHGMWGTTNFIVHGLVNIQFSHFEIDLYFSSQKIMITDAGRTIIRMEAPVIGSFLQAPIQKESHYNCLNNYMENVISYAAGLLYGTNTKDNFLDSVKLNQQMLTFIQN